MVSLSRGQDSIEIVESKGFEVTSRLLPENYIIELMCEVKGKNVKVEWCKGKKKLSNNIEGVVITNDSAYQGSVITLISKLKYKFSRASGMEGSYKCQVVDSDLPDGEMSCLDAKENKEKHINYQLPQFYIDELQKEDYGRDVFINWTLSCKKNSQNKTIESMIWRFDGKIICQYDNQTTCSNTEKYNLYSHENGLLIKNLTIEDSGEYELTVNCSKKTKSRKYTLVLEAPPRVKIREPLFCIHHQPCTASCEFVGSPETIKWSLQYTNGTCSELSQKRRSNHSSKDIHTSIYIFTCTETAGINVTCLVGNSLGNTSKSTNVHFCNDEEGFLVKGISVAARGYPLELTCVVSPTYYQKKLIWYEDSRFTDPIDDNITQILETEYSYESVLNLEPMIHNKIVSYYCKAIRVHDGISEWQEHTISIKDPKSVRIFDSNLTNEVREWTPGIKLYCKAGGLPSPSIQWCKDGNPLSGERFKIDSNSYADTSKSYLTLIGAIDTEDYGNYSCVVTNPLGIQVKYVYYKLSDAAKLRIFVLSVLGGLLIIFIVAVLIHFGISYYRRRCPVTVPLFYDESLNFPRERLVTGMELGRGRFGAVKKSLARGIFGDETQTETVAVKMNHLGASKNDIQLLKAELDIMVRIGRHHNIVTLLKASMDLTGPEAYLLIIFEFYQHGSVHDYLCKHKKYFLGHTADEVPDISLSAEEDSHVGHHPCPVALADLHYWSFQIAKGMEFISSKNVIHRDLAARNILLADKNVVKIGDFGLAKDISNMSGYKEECDVPLPVASMSIEAHKNEEVTTASDVWSFGVLMWELYSLARTPYDGLQRDKIRDFLCVRGLRLDRPEHADDAIYEVMLQCWREIPRSRPSFQQLGELMQAHLSQEHSTVVNSSTVF